MSTLEFRDAVVLVAGDSFGGELYLLKLIKRWKFDLFEISVFLVRSLLRQHVFQNSLTILLLHSLEVIACVLKNGRGERLSLGRDYGIVPEALSNLETELHRENLE